MNQLFGKPYSRRIKSAIVAGIQYYSPAPIVGDWLTIKPIKEMTPRERESYVNGFIARWKGHPYSPIIKGESDNDTGAERST